MLKEREEMEESRERIVKGKKKRKQIREKRERRKERRRERGNLHTTSLRHRNGKRSHRFCRTVFSRLDG